MVSLLLDLTPARSQHQFIRRVIYTKNPSVVGGRNQFLGN